MRFTEQKFRTVGILGSLLVLIIGVTLRFKVLGIYPKRNFIVIFWHGKFFPLLYKFRGKGITVLATKNRDGEFSSRIVERLGYNVFRGSSEDRGLGTLRGLLNLKSIIAITPDGPKGERCKLKDGFLKFVKFLRCPIVPVGVGVKWKYEFSSWDRFNLPLPFSKCVLNISPPIDPHKIEKSSLEALFIKIDNEAEELVKCL